MKIILASMENEHNLNLAIKAEVKFVLMNHLYIKSWKNAEKLLKMAKDNNVSVLMDSGCFMFKQSYLPLRVDWETYRYDPCITMSQESLDQMAEALRKEGITVETVREKAKEYIKGYLKNMPLYYEMCENVAELDIDMV